MLIRLRSRDGLERVTVSSDSSSTTVAQLKSLIESQLGVPTSSQTLSLNKDLLLAKSPSDLTRFTDLLDPHARITSLGITHGSMLYLSYEGTREVVGPKPVVSPAGSFGRRMTMDDLIAKQMRITRQENPHCELVSFDRDSANAFQQYVNEALAFAVKRCGFMYGNVSEEGKVEVDFIYEPPQAGTEEKLVLMRDTEEEKAVEAIARGLGMRRVGFIFTQAVGQNKDGYTMSADEVALAIELQAEGDLKEWVTALVKLEVNEDGGADVHFEAFQMSDLSVRLFKEGWFDFGEDNEGGKEEGKEIDPKVSRMKKDVVVGGKDVREVDNDFFLVVVKIFDHQGPLTSSFPIENRNIPSSMRSLQTHLNRAKSLPFVKRVSDFHLLLFIARFLDISADLPAIAQCVRTQMPIPEGYELLIESMAGAA